MSLVNEFEKQGNFLFRYRGQFPVLLFLLAVPFLYWTDSSSIIQFLKNGQTENHGQSNIGKTYMGINAFKGYTV